MNTLHKHPHIEIVEGKAFFRCVLSGHLVPNRIGLPSFLVLKRKINEEEAKDIYGAFATWNRLYLWLKNKHAEKAINDDRYLQCIEWIESTVGTKIFNSSIVNSNVSVHGVPEVKIEVVAPCFGTAAEEYAMQQRLKDEKKKQQSVSVDLRSHLLRQGINIVRSYNVTTIPELGVWHAEETDVQPSIGLEYMREVTGCDFGPENVPEGETLITAHKPNKWNSRQEAWIKKHRPKPTSAAEKKTTKIRIKKVKSDNTKPPFPVTAT